jgi:ABC-type multidrug transport system ATPase subunit
MNLVIRDLSKTYPNGTRALKDVSLDVPKGMFGLLGRNGAGKSTLMRILATLQEPDEGSVRLGDIDVLRQRHEVRKTLGYLPQSFGFHAKAKAERLLDHFAVLKGIEERGVRRDVVAALLRQTNLWDVRGERLGTFSGGMRQRFGVAVALLGNPKLIIVDEPTAGLDPEERVRFLNLLSQIGEDSVVILSTHIVEDVEELCSRMAIIDGGEILLEAEPLRAMDDLRGRIWRRTVSRAELSALEAELPVISTKLLAGRTIVHVHADASPGAEFEIVEPELEDVYFSVMAGHHGRRGPVAGDRGPGAGTGIPGTGAGDAGPGERSTGAGAGDAGAVSHTAADGGADHLEDAAS